MRPNCYYHTESDVFRTGSTWTGVRIKRWTRAGLPRFAGLPAVGCGPIMFRNRELGMLYVREQCHECRVVREISYGPDETLQGRRFHDPGRWLEADE